jgi:hypothetical protein
MAYLKYKNQNGEWNTLQLFTEDNSVFYTKNQTLSNSQKETARNNISASSQSHALTHASGGSDPITPGSIGAVSESAFDGAFLSHAARHGVSGADQITPASIGASGVSSVVSATLLAASWAGAEAPFGYTLSVSGVTAASAVEVLPPLNPTVEQLEALQGANLQDGGQAPGSITLKAYGDKPTIDLPIRMIIRGDL